MAYQLGTKINQSFERNEAASSTTTELVTAIVGPLFEVHKQVAHATRFDPLSGSAQTFTWPGKRTGTVVDLYGVKNGLIDDQVRDLGEWPARVYLKDGSTYAEVDSSLISAVGQTGFTLAATAAAASKRVSITAHVISLEGQTFLYHPAGSFSESKVGDVLTVGSTDTSIETIASTRITAADDISGDADTPGHEFRYDGSDDVDISLAAAAGRIEIAVAPTPIGAPAISQYDAVVVGKPIPDLDALSGALDGNDGTEIDGLTFASLIGADELDGYMARITMGANVYWRKIVSVDTGSGVLNFDSAFTGETDDTAAAVVVYKGQVGYVESVNASTGIITAVVPTPFSDTNTYCDVYTEPTSIDVYPDYEVAVSYRALRADKAGEVDVITSDELLATIGVSGTQLEDGIGKMAAHYFAVAGAGVELALCYVDLEAGGTTGLPANYDLGQGYSDALEELEMQEVFQIVTLHQSSAVQALVRAHITAMNDPEVGSERRYFQLYDVPSGETESSLGRITPGKVSGGSVAAAGGTQGNGNLYDDSVAFVTEAGLGEGDTVVVVSPGAYAGTYTVGADVTDDVLPLDGVTWSFTRSMSVTSGSPTVTTSGSTHTISGAPAGSFLLAEEDDYVEFTAGGTTYRAHVESVNATGTSITVTTETPVTPTFSADAVTNLSVIRSWSEDALPAVVWYAKPLTRAAKRDQIIANKSVTDRMVSLTPDNTVTISDGVDELGAPVTKSASAVFAQISCAAWRSRLKPHEEVTNRFLGGFITDIERGFNFFRSSDLNAMGEVGLMWFSKATPSAEPFVRDMITSAWSSLTVAEGEEVVVANAYWQAKSLRRTFGSTPGSAPPEMDTILLSIRRGEVDSVLRSWRDVEKRIRGYRDLQVAFDSSDPRGWSISYTVTQKNYVKNQTFDITNTIQIT